MGKKFVQPHKHKKDHIFVAPPGSKEVFTDTNGSEVFLISQVAQQNQTVPNDQMFIGGGLDVEIVLSAPNVFSIVDQKLRRGPGGVTSVDIIIDCEDIPNATEYEVSMALAVT